MSCGKKYKNKDDFREVPASLQVLLHGVPLPAAGSGSKLRDGAGHVCMLLWRGSFWQAGHLIKGCSEFNNKHDVKSRFK